MPWNVLIVDDEAPARLNLECALSGHSDWHIVGSAKSAAEARDILRKESVDLIFLDIRMPHENGLQFAESLCRNEHSPLIVFVTAYDEHALAAFDVYALDYILKPFDDERFSRMLSQASSQLLMRHLKTVNQQSDVLRFVTEQQTYDAQGQSPYLDYIVVRSVGLVERIAINDIEWMASAGNYVELHLANRRVLHRSSMAHLEKRLNPAVFMRVHRTAIVRRKMIANLAVEGDGLYALTLRSGNKVPVSERFVQDVRQEMEMETARSK